MVAIYGCCMLATSSNQILYMRLDHVFDNSYIHSLTHSMQFFQQKKKCILHFKNNVSVSIALIATQLIVSIFIKYSFSFASCTGLMSFKFSLFVRHHRLWKRCLLIANYTNRSRYTLLSMLFLYLYLARNVSLRNRALVKYNEFRVVKNIRNRNK